jgi:hypothetical protein
MVNYTLSNDDFLDPPKSIFWRVRHFFSLLIPIILIFLLIWFLIGMYKNSDLVALNWEENKKLFYYNFSAAFATDDSHEKAAQTLQTLPDDMGGFERRNRERTNDVDILNIGLKMYQYRFIKLPIAKNPEPIKRGSRIYKELKMVLSHVPTDPLPIGEESDYIFQCVDGYRYTIIMFFEEMGGDIQQKRIKREYSNN